ncbi:MAG: RNA-binding protein [Oligoflexia bacterium]|nr:RNA-binding protein [Oligoflexia bacterium]
MKKLFIGKLSFSTSADALRAAFAAYEPLSSVKIISDKMTGRSRGFGFIELDDNAMAASAISEMDGAMLDGRAIAVSEARPQGDNSRSGGFRSGYRSGGGARY